ncbi:MAG TPA: DUF3164 family protein [Kiritimatiellia bacterium]|nr:DUF3164 family protein [Kiritimatiellia bacterium]HRU71497.1 DUF3164 family protein [Kiritimatiellia bacterium]
MSRETVEITCGPETAAALEGIFQEMAEAYEQARARQDTDAEGVPDGYVKNAKGWLLPAADVKSKDLLEGRFVDEFHRLAAAAAAACAHVRLAAFAESDALVGMIVEDAGGCHDGHAGKVTLQNMRATRRITIDRRDTVAFGPEVQAAKDLVMACVRKWSDGANAHLVQLAMAAFQANGRGDLSVSKVAALWRIECQDADWQTAMAALKEALRPTGTASYLRFHERTGPDGKWQLIEARI